MYAFLKKSPSEMLKTYGIRHETISKAQLLKKKEKRHETVTEPLISQNKYSSPNLALFQSQSAAAAARKQMQIQKPKLHSLLDGKQYHLRQY